MVDVAVRRAPCFTPAGALAPVPPLSRFIFRGDEAACASASAAFAVTLPGQACRAVQSEGRAALWLGPDEWLLLAPEGEGAALQASLAGALRLQAHSLVDVSHRQVGLVVQGPRVEWLLEAQCPLPLNLRDFPAGMCTRTIFGKAEVVLWRQAAHVFRIEVWRSFAPYVFELLQEIDRESVA
jgi:sarcosine oxidase, subunit gamma